MFRSDRLKAEDSCACLLLRSNEFTDVIFVNRAGLHVAVEPALEVQSRGMFLMVPPTLVLTMRPLFDPPLKLILPKPPGAANLKTRQLAFPG